MRKRTAGEWAKELASRDLGRVGGTGAGLADRAESFWGCVQCTTCTGVCPVVAVSEDPSRDLDLAPQQIMNLLRMGLKAQTLGARMVWSCTTCYKCQEHCPQGVPVADILYELRQLGAETLRKKEGRT
jgi:heterodisulfide reductase subunit C